MQLQWKSEWTIPSVVGVVSFGIGISVGYGIRYYLDNRLVRSFSDIMDEVKSNEEQLRFNLNGHNSEVDELTEEEEEHNHLDLVIDRSSHPAMHGFIPEPESIFPDFEGDDWDYEEELKTRNPDAPYIIHRLEYEDEQTDDGITYSKSTLTYYKGDDVLCDELDVPIYNAEKVAAPLIFGKGSQDPSIVYIRNDKLEADYEVILDHGYYTVEILGEEIEDSFNSKKTPLPKFRPE